MFGNPGTTELPLMDGLAREPGIRYVLALQEAPAIAMTDGYAQASGGLGAVNVHVSPGLGNAMGMLYDAYKAGSPLLVTAGQHDQCFTVTEPILWSDLPPVARPYVKWSTEAHRLEDLPRIVRRAVKTALAHPTGPVFLSLPVADQPGGDARGGAEIDVALVVQHVHRQREEHRAGGMRERGLRGAMHDARQVLQAMGLGRPLHVGPGHRRQIRPEDRLGHREALIVLPGRHQQRRAGLVGVVEHAHRVAEAGRDVHVHGAEATAGLRVAVGHRDGRRLLQGQHVTDAGLAGEAVHERQLRRAGVAEHHGDAFLPEDLEERLLAGDEWHGGRDDKPRRPLIPGVPGCDPVRRARHRRSVDRARRPA